MLSETPPRPLEARKGERVVTESTDRTPVPRRWHVPAPLISGGTGLPGVSILDEFPNELGTLLWHSLRTVRQWAAAPSTARRKLFLPGAFKQAMADLEAVASEAALQQPLAIIAGLLKNPTKTDAVQIGAACARIAEWAQEQNARATAWEFTQAAALASPADPKAALAAGRAARDRAEYPVAEAWYQRAIALARRARDWDTYARAYIGLGKMWTTRGAYPSARKHLLKAVRVASRQRLRLPTGMAFHDLFALEAACNHDREALAYAEAALKAYPRGHPDLPSLAYSLAFFWAERGQFAPALPVLKAVIPRVQPIHQPYVQGGLARTAGGMGDSQTFDAAWTAVWGFDDSLPGKADGLLEAARGAISLARWNDARQAASRALEIAQQRHQSSLRLDAEGVLQSIESERAAFIARRRRKTRAASGEGITAESAELSQRIVEALAAIAPRAFNGAAVPASPADPKSALAEARAARDRAEYEPAEAGYQRAIKLARRARDWETYARAYIGLGTMWMIRGSHPTARRYFLKAARVASREGLRDVHGMALHDLFILASYAHNDAEAISYALAAARRYPRGNPNLAALAYDVAFFWVLRGQFAPALPVLKAAVPQLTFNQVLGSGGLARAAGALRDVPTFDAAWREVWAFDDDTPNKADALVDAARGAMSLGRWDDARQAASRALEIALRRSQSSVRLDAEGVLESIESEQAAFLAGRSGEEKAPVESEASAQASELARQIVDALAGATAREFAETEPLESSADAKDALQEARAARDRADYPAAEAGYERAVVLARRARDWETYARAHIGLGNMWRKRGAYPSARKHFQKAARIASREQLTEARGMALHDLFAVEAQRHNDEQAQAYAAAALHAYGPHHRLLPHLAHDVAYLWMERGHFAVALPVVQAVMPYLSARFQLRAKGSLARAAGGIGDAAVFEANWREVIAAPDDALDRADTLLDAAQGAASLGRWNLAEFAAQRALEISRERKEAEIAHKAEGLLESVRHERAAATRRNATPVKQDNSLGEATAEPRDLLARDLVGFLAAGGGARVS